MDQRSDRMFIGIGGHLVALDPATGTEMWRTKLRTSSFVTVWVSDGRVFAGAGGETFCVDPASGDILWRNGLRGLGMGVVAFASSSEMVVGSAFEAGRSAAAGTAANVATG